jgi:hypothetical protein
VKNSAVQIVAIVAVLLLGALSLARSDGAFLSGLILAPFGVFLTIRFLRRRRMGTFHREKNPTQSSLAWGAPRFGLLLLIGQGVFILLFIGFWRTPKSGGLAGLGDAGIFLFFLMGLFAFGFSGVQNAFGLFRQRRAIWIGVPLVLVSATSLALSIGLTLWSFVR